MAPIMDPEAVESVSSCFYLGGESQCRVHVILELLSTSPLCEMLGIDLLENNGT